MSVDRETEPQRGVADKSCPDADKSCPELLPCPFCGAVAGQVTQAMNSKPTPTDNREILLRSCVFGAIENELSRAYSKHGCKPWGRHEFYAILKEEVDEVWDAIAADADEPVIEFEIIQVAAMCFRYLETRGSTCDCGSEDTGLWTFCPYCGLKTKP